MWLSTEAPEPEFRSMPFHCPAALSWLEVKTTGLVAVPWASRVPLTLNDPVSLTTAPGSAVTVTPEAIVTELPVYGLSAAVSVMLEEIVVGSGVADACSEPKAKQASAEQAIATASRIRRARVHSDRSTAKPRGATTPSPQPTSFTKAPKPQKWRDPSPDQRMPA